MDIPTLNENAYAVPTSILKYNVLHLIVNCSKSRDLKSVLNY